MSRHDSPNLAPWHWLIGLTVLAVTGCGAADPAPDDLVGTYSARDGDAMVEVVKIEKQAADYVFYEKRGDGWRKAEQPMRTVTRDELAKVVGRAIEVPFVGLATKNVAVFKMPAGWQADDFTTATGYFMKVGFGPVELHKK